MGPVGGLDIGERLCGQADHGEPRRRSSLQLHHHREEHWVIVRGRGRVTRGDEIFELARNQSVFIPLETAHRVENIGRRSRL